MVSPLGKRKLTSSGQTFERTAFTLGEKAGFCQKKLCTEERTVRDENMKSFDPGGVLIYYQHLLITE
jgi:hypothetical protein